MFKKDFNTRTCIVSRKKFKKDELLRFVKIGNEIILDEKQNKQGRGFYVYPSKENYDKMLKTRALNRALKMEVPMEQYISLKEYFNL